MDCQVEGRDLREAENAAIVRAALKSRALPREMDVRHLHQCMERRNPTETEYLCA
jgi:alpha-D-ribose 1-methylphosphonate 5-triphosphate synthase subunit PhnG